MKFKIPKFYIFAVLLASINFSCKHLPTSSEFSNNDDSDAIVEITDDFKEKIKDYWIIENYSEGRAPVLSNDKWGFINTKGDLKIPAIYSKVQPFSEGLAYVEKEKNKPGVFIDRNGNEVFSLDKVNITTDFHNGKIVAYSAKIFGYDDYDIGNHFEVIDKNGNILQEIPIPKGAKLIDDSITNFFSPVEITDDGFGFWVSDDEMYNYYNYYDFQGNLIQQSSSPKQQKDFSEYPYVVFTERIGTWDDIHTMELDGIRDRDGNIITPAKEWMFQNGVFDIDSKKRFIKPSNGVFLVVLEEDSYYLNNVDKNRIEEESYSASYYGFVDLNGQDSFTDERWERQRIQRYNRLNSISK